MFIKKLISFESAYKLNDNNIRLIYSFSNVYKSVGQIILIKLYAFFAFSTPCEESNEKNIFFQPTIHLNTIHTFEYVFRKASECILNPLLPCVLYMARLTNILILFFSRDPQKKFQ